MTSDIAMSTPVTRGELREELAQFENRIERKFDDRFDQVERKFDSKLEHLERRFDSKLEQLEHRFDGKLEQLEHRFDGKLELWGGALLARIAATEQRIELWGGALLARIAESEQRLLGELARHTQAVYESMTKQISVVDEKYNDLPGRTARLEADVHALKQR